MTLRDGRRLRLVWVVLVVLVAAASAQAHHSFNDIFDVNTVSTLKGTISKIDWINPHVYIEMDVPDEKGAVTTWRLESLPTAMLRKAGLTSEMIKGSGQQVTAVAILARNGTPNLGWLLNLTYEDGHEYVLAGE
jgi:hypothetical protein